MNLWHLKKKNMTTLKTIWTSNRVEKLVNASSDDLFETKLSFCMRTLISVNQKDEMGKRFHEW